MIRKASLSAVLFAAFLTTAAPAEEPAAAPGAWPSTVTVSGRIDLGDLDLGTAAGAAEARRRVARAVNDLCRPLAVPSGAGRGRVDGRCYRAAMAAARMQIEPLIAARSGGVRTAAIAPAPEQ
jgi:UrcA family protein